jgi:hypothetical protein
MAISYLFSVCRKICKGVFDYYKAKHAHVSSMSKVVSFDVVGTLVDFGYEDYVWKEVIPQFYARKRGVNIEEAKDYVLKEYDRIGKNDIRWYLPEH